MLATNSTAAARGFLALLSLILVLGLAPNGAQAAEPCWKTLLDDWYDGGIGATYPRACYRGAIRHLPADALLYSNAKAEITAALRERSLMSSPTSAQADKNRARGTADRTLASVGATSTRSAPIAPIAVAAAAMLLLVCAVAWRAVRRQQR